MRKKCADAGLLQTSLGSVCEFHSPDPAVVRKNVEDCREWVLLAKDIGARAVKVRPERPAEGRARGEDARADRPGARGVRRLREGPRRRDLGRGPRRPDEGPGPDAPDHGRLLAPDRRPDLELERHRRRRRIGRRSPSGCCGPSSAAATSPTCGAATRTASSSRLLRSRASPASRCASTRRRSPRSTARPGSRTTGSAGRRSSGAERELRELVCPLADSASLNRSDDFPGSSDCGVREPLLSHLHHRCSRDA